MIGKDAQVQVQRRCAVRSCRSGRNEPRAFIEVSALGLLVKALVPVLTVMAFAGQTTR